MGGVMNGGVSRRTRPPQNLHAAAFGQEIENQSNNSEDEDDQWKGNTHGESDERWNGKRGRITGEPQTPKN